MQLSKYSLWHKFEPKYGSDSIKFCKIVVFWLFFASLSQQKFNKKRKVTSSA